MNNNIKISCIYIIKSILKPERIYIGSARDFKMRKGTHLHELRNNYHGNGKLQNHYNKYGESDLSFEVIEIVSNPFELLSREQFFINSMNPFFNICKIAGSRIGVKVKTKRIVSLETRGKISKANKGKYRREGYRHSQETIEKMRKSQSAMSDARKMNISKSKIGSKNPSAKRVINVMTGEVYGTIVEAAIKNNVCENTVRQSIYKRKKKGIIFNFY